MSNTKPIEKSVTESVRTDWDVDEISLQLQYRHRGSYRNSEIPSSLSRAPAAAASA